MLEPTAQASQALLRIFDQTKESLAVSRSCLESNPATPGPGLLPTLPQWAKEQICKARELDCAVKLIKISCPSARLCDADELISQCRAIQREMELRFGGLAVENQLQTITPYADKNKLLVHLGSDPAQWKPISPQCMEWHVHLGLLMQAYLKTEDPELRKTIAFLAANYLAKVVPYANDSQVEKQAAEMFQWGLFNQVPHHREDPAFESFLLPEISKYLNCGGQDRKILIDTKHIEDLLPLWFDVLPLSEELGKKMMAERLRDHLSQGFDWTEYFKKPFLFDLTPYLEEYIVSGSESDAASKAIFEKKRRSIEEKIDRMVRSVARRLSREFPQIIGTEADKDRLKALIRSNIACICRNEVRGTGILTELSIFSDSKYFDCSSVQPLLKTSPRESQARFAQLLCQDRQAFFQIQFDEFVNVTGVRLGAVRGRHAVFDFLSLRDFLAKHYGSSVRLVEFDGAAPEARIFKKKEDFINSRAYQKCKQMFASPSIDNAYLNILGMPLLEMLEGFLNKFDEGQWNRLNDREDIRQILQTSLYRITVHLANAHFHSRNYGRFTQEMEIVQNELMDLLAILGPYRREDFQKIYLRSIAPNIPPTLPCQVTAGLTKCGMNSLAAILAAVHKKNPHPELTYGSGVYTESWGYIGKNRNLPAILNNNDIQKVDFYLGEFNHNISIHLDTDRYVAGDVIKEVQALLDAKPGIEHLTVAIDGTIDFHNSEKSKQVLEFFGEGIKAGKLNFVFFRSGQKYDMLGMDNVYGSPYYVVNNGDIHWKDFNDIRSYPGSMADDLSLQWFSLLYEFAPQATDIYRRQIFANAREILKHVPPSLEPGRNAKIKVCQVDDGMQPSFIDIKVLDPNGAKIAGEIKAMFLSKFTDRGLKAHARASFGFFHPNINMIGSSLDGQPRNVRLNPGLNPKDIPIFAEFLQELAQRYS